MSIDSLILRIAIPSPLRQSFDYLPPIDYAGQKLQPGIRIEVPFGKRRKVVGVLLEVAAKSQVAFDRMKPALNILDLEPLISPALFKLNYWLSDYLHAPIGEVIVGNLPKKLRQGKPAELKLKKPKQFTVEAAGFALNEHQQHVLARINKESGYNCFLLDGVTGSGKTEVYLRVIEACLKRNQQALVLVPEIGLTPQMLQRFEQRLAAHIAVLHSGLTDNERCQAWLRASLNKAQVIIGTRSAIFTPLPKLGVIIVDEEHDLSFKQQSGLRYSARDVAIMRANFENVPIILGSATPSLESLHNVKQKRYHYLRLPKRAGQAKQPHFTVIDVRSQRLDDGLSAQLIHAIKKHLAEKGQILLFLNRRGYAPTLLCTSCGWVAACTRCDARLTLHHGKRRLHCHHCDRTLPLLTSCPECNSNELKPLGMGTERLEMGLKKHFPDVPLIRIDRDTTRRKGTMQTMLQEIKEQRHSILLGTQMLAKGHHFPNVTMSAVLNIDSGLLSADFRAVEHVAQLIVQVAGRAGRAEKLGEVYLQTYNPQHPLLLALIKHGYHNFVKVCFAERQLTGLPPFSYFALIRAESLKSSEPLHFLTELRDIARGYNLPQLNVLGPIPAPMERKAGRYRMQLLLQAKQRTTLHKLLQHLVPAIKDLKTARKVRWSLDVDPVDMSS